MAVHNFTTGPSTLPDVGQLSYNGCVFSPLFATQISGTVIKDEAQRTTKFMEYNIKVDGYVTLPDNDTSINSNMSNLRRLLTAQAGVLIYVGRGFDLFINAAAGFGTSDVAWGPIPELLEFQPLGAGRSAKVVWQVKTRIAEIDKKLHVVPGGGAVPIPLLQFNYETSVSYGEDGFSSISVNGVVEIPLTRGGQKNRTLTQTADNVREIIDSRVMSGIDLSRFRMTNRNFNLSRDKRTLTFSLSAEERPYMDLPKEITSARGTYNVRPSQSGMGLCNWLCTIRATYTVRADQPRRVAWFSFLLLLRERMSQSTKGVIPKFEKDQNSDKTKIKKTQRSIGVGSEFFDEFFKSLFTKQKKEVDLTTKPMLLDFNIDEGLYLDSKTITFSATWRTVTAFSHILLASGIWRKVPEKNDQGKNLWAISMSDIQGSKSWLANKADPSLDVIVDFGG